MSLELSSNDPSPEVVQVTESALLTSAVRLTVSPGQISATAGVTVTAGGFSQAHSSKIMVNCS